MSPPTIVQLLPQLNAGGVERGTLEINRALVAAGYRSIVVSGGGRLVPQLEREGGQHVCMQVWKKRPSSLLTVPGLRRWIIDVQPDVLHARSRVPAWITWLAIKGLPAADRPRFLTTAHGMNKPNMYSAIMTRGEKVIAVSNTCRDYLLKHYPKTDPAKVTVVHRGVSPDEFPHGYQPTEAWKRDWSQAWPQLKNQFVAVVAGRVTRFKGHRDFITALAQLKQRGVTIYGVIAGGEDPRRKGYSNELRQLLDQHQLTDQVVFTGHRSDIRDVVAACDVSVSTSIQPPESFGRSVLESVRLGKITLGYAHGGVGEVLGTVYPEGRIPLRDVDTLAARLADAKAGRIQPPAPNHEFLLTTMQQKTLAIYDELTAARRQQARKAA